MLAVLLALDTIGTGLGALAVFGSAPGVGLGFGLSGSPAISVDRSGRRVITIGDKFGWVRELRARYSVDASD